MGSGFGLDPATPLRSAQDDGVGGAQDDGVGGVQYAGWVARRMMGWVACRMTGEGGAQDDG